MWLTYLLPTGCLDPPAPAVGEAQHLTRKYLMAMTSRRSVIAASAGVAAVAGSAGVAAADNSTSGEKTTRRKYWDPITAKNSVLVLIDHQPSLLAGVGSTSTTNVINNVVALAKCAKLFGVPTVLTSVLADRGGKLLFQIRDVFPGQTVYDRTTLNAWEDVRVRRAIEKTGARKVLLAGLWTDICVAFPAFSTLDAGYEVYAVTDASAAITAESHDMAVRRMVDAGVTPTNWATVQSELQRDWANTATVPGVAKISKEHAGAFGAILDLEEQLLDQ
ncbi:hydrolase [Streptomyces griseoincarnatus]